MKKFLISLIFLFLLLLSSCDKVQVSEPQYPLVVNGTVDAEYYFSSFSAGVNTEEDSTITLIVKKPKLLSGWKIVLNSNGTKVEGSSIALEYEDNQLEKFCPLARLYDILSSVNSQKPRFVLFGESYSANFEHDGEQCVVLVNAESGTVEKISTKDCILTFYG